ncbi:MAG TPA: sigma-70 family RNA polymerase sigma factor [Sandaracinaceae bacterium]
MEARAEAMQAADPIADLIREGRHREAAARCAREHGAAVGRLCMALLGDQAEAEETVQETLIAAHDAMGAFRGEGSVRAWLYGIARRKCARKLEMRLRRQRRLRLVHDAEAAAAPDELLEAQRRAERVRSALEQLKPSERDAVVLRYTAGLGYREIGEACGIDEAAARKRVSRALARMRNLLSDEGGR